MPKTVIVTHQTVSGFTETPMDFIKFIQKIHENDFWYSSFELQENNFFKVTFSSLAPKLYTLNDFHEILETIEDSHRIYETLEVQQHEKKFNSMKEFLESEKIR